jgi:hypothetical protein
MLQQLPLGTRIVVHGATTELDPEFFGARPSVDTGCVVMSAAQTAGVEFDDGVELFGIPWAVIEPRDTTDR